MVPAGSPARWRWSGCFDWLHIFLEPGLVARVAAEAFDLDPARLTVPPLDGLDLPHLRAAMGAVDAELTIGVAGERLAAESAASNGRKSSCMQAVTSARPQIAAHAGCSDQSQFSHQFKRKVGITPGQFRTPARIA